MAPFPFSAKIFTLFPHHRSEEEHPSTMSTASELRNLMNNFTILWSTEGGKAKACARRAARMLREAREGSDTDTGSGSVSGSVSGSGSTNLLSQDGYYGSSFDDYGAQEVLDLGSRGDVTRGEQLLIMFVSTTGDAEHTDSIRHTWAALLQKSLPSNQFANIKIAIFCLGDRAYGPSAFCAAGRKLAARMVQLGASPFCPVGYGDEGTPNGGVFCDLDVWLEQQFLSSLFGTMHTSIRIHKHGNVRLPKSPYQVSLSEASTGENIQKKVEYNKNSKKRQEEWTVPHYSKSYDRFFASISPTNAYHFNEEGRRILESEEENASSDPQSGAPLLGTVLVNERITSPDWSQDTRHISIHVTTELPPASSNSNITNNAPNKSIASLPYLAGDVAIVIPTNPTKAVQQFLKCLPPSLSKIADQPLDISTLLTSTTQYSTSFTHWPTEATLRGILTFCADICSLPEREDLRSLSVFCNPKHPMGIAQRTKLVELSETQSAALFGDYVIREKRNWGDILFDFDSIMFEDNDEENENRMNEDGFIPLILDRLLAILPPIRPRHFSIASAPSKCKETSNDSSAYSVQNGKLGFDLDLCVAVVKGQTPHGRPYQGLCSGYLAHRKAFHFVRVWIRPGSFARLPLEPNDPNRSSSHRLFEAPVLFIGAGTGVAPLRSMIRERETIQKGFIPNGFDSSKDCKPSIIVNTNVDNILIFGCRKSSVDYYYGSEWEVLNNSNRLRVFTAFSQEQARKIYVQKVARELGEGQFIGKHILERGGAVYIAGGAKMARAVRDEIVEALGKILPQGNNGAKNLLKKLQRVGKFNVEAWS